MQTARYLLLTLWIAFSGFVITGIACATILLVAARRPRSPLIDSVMLQWAKAFLRFSHTTLEVRGAESIDENQPYVIVSNHRSDLDIPVSVLAAGIPIRFMAKKELFDVPVFGRTLRAMGMIEVNRQHGATAHSEVNEAARAISADRYSIMVYPEGTRTRDGAMLPFKKGAFAVAIDRGMPVLPVTIHGTDNAWRTGGLVKGGHVIAEVGKPIETVGLTRQDIGALTQQVRDVVESTYDNLSSVSA